ncbi:MAG TPA: hypothetical protein VK898_11830 [Chloroflexota bacterium]|nr:hypothetical protein [Chloroflexota bacterium]
MDEADLVRLVDRLEEQAESYVTLDEVQRATLGSDVSQAIADGVLLVDYRTRADGSPITLCRLNRRHPRVMELTRW